MGLGVGGQRDPREKEGQNRGGGVGGLQEQVGAPPQLPPPAALVSLFRGRVPGPKAAGQAVDHRLLHPCLTLSPGPIFFPHLQCGPGPRPDPCGRGPEPARPGPAAGEHPHQRLCHPVPGHHRGPRAQLPAGHRPHRGRPTTRRVRGARLSQGHEGAVGPAVCAAVCANPGLASLA